MRRMILSDGGRALSEFRTRRCRQRTDNHPPPDGGSPAVEAATGNQDGTAFTGSDTAVPMVAAGGLLVLGASTLVVARRRARRLQGYSG